MMVACTCTSAAKVSVSACKPPPLSAMSGLVALCSLGPLEGALCGAASYLVVVGLLAPPSRRGGAGFQGIV